MTTAMNYSSPEGLSQIESGLKNLKKSKMLVFPEFKTLVNTVNKHHSDVKLAHLTGMSQDSMEAARRDTKFYNILLSMLLEIKDYPGTCGKDELTKIYNWYLANKSVKKSHFGKAAQVEDAREILKDTIRQQSHRSQSRNSNSASGGRKSLDSIDKNIKEEKVNIDNERIQRKVIGVHSKRNHNEEMELYSRSSTQKSQSTIVPIPALINPHRDLASREAEKAEEEYRSRTQSRASSAHLQSARMPNEETMQKLENLQMWNRYKQNMAYGQDILSHLKFLGRSGTPYDVRYVAHDFAEKPEYHTSVILTKENKEKIDSTDINNNNNMVLHQTLTDFYRSADAYASNIEKSRCRKPKSAPAGSKKKKTIVHDLESPLKGTKRTRNDDKPMEQRTTDVKLDSVVSVIDSVTDNMRAFKEKLVPEPNAGFRQPISTNVPSAAELSRIASARSFSPGGTTNTPISSPNVSRRSSPPAPLTLSSNDIIEQPKSKTDGKKTPHDLVIEAIDWRGKVTPTPDTRRSRWSDKNSYGTCYKRMPLSSRSAGTGPSGRRPKTAPTTVQEKWNTKKHNEHNSRTPQAASHMTTQVDQPTVDKMLKVQYMGGHTSSDSSAYGSGRYGFNFNDELLAYLREQEAKKPSLQFLSFLVPKTALIPKEKMKPSSQKTVPSNHERLTSEPEAEEIQANSDDNNSMTVGQDLDGSEQGSQRVEYIENFVNRDINVKFAETEMELERCDSESRKSFDVDPPVIDNIQIEISAIAPYGHSFFHSSKQEHDMQQLTPSEIYSFSTGDMKSGHHGDSVKNIPRCRSAGFCNSQTKFSPILMNSLNPSASDSPIQRVERSAGRGPGRPMTALEQMHRMSLRHPEFTKIIPSLRTPPSIPSSTHPFSVRSEQKKVPPYNIEHELHARKDRSPRHYIERITNLRQPDEIESPCLSFDEVQKEIPSSLKVCRLPKPQKTSASSEQSYGTDAEFLQSILRERPSAAQRKRVGFQENYLLSKRISDPLEQAPSVSVLSKQTGRPIPQVKHIPDPDITAALDNQLKDAKAAVDIQRIFRGYIARNNYMMLLKEEREKLEDKQKAALHIQRNWRGHVIRKQNILNRPEDEDIVEWKNNYKSIQNDYSTKRKQKMQAIAEQDSQNYREAADKISVIGPHVDIYRIYCSKPTGPNKYDLFKASTFIQKNIRGWLQRRRIEKLKRKATTQGAEWADTIKEYKSLLRRVQKRHGIEKTSAPFTIEEMTEWLEKKKHYEAVFDKKAFGNELEQCDVEAFFKECDLFPSNTEVEEAINAVFRGKKEKLKNNKGLRKKDVLELVFHIYVPPATGLKNTRESTWLNPIIDGEEARKLIGNEFVEPAPLETCMRLVVESGKERRKEAAAKMKSEDSKKEEDDAH